MWLFQYSSPFLSWCSNSYLTLEFFGGDTCPALSPVGSRSLPCVSVRLWTQGSDHPSPRPWGHLLLPLSQKLCIFSRALRRTRVFCPRRCRIRQWSGEAELVLCLCDTNVLSLASCPNFNLSAELSGNALKRKKSFWMSLYPFVSGGSLGVCTVLSAPSGLWEFVTILAICFLPTSKMSTCPSHELSEVKWSLCPISPKNGCYPLKFS